ncbi:cell death abnormality protein 8-like [Littorina saxatilis]|uniref:cell death abnormality protein 8-like n=1 Tax=Littorina saxatilis TaxID=31220 RepID=UPI0038B4D4AA
METDGLLTQMSERDSTSLPWHYKLGRCLVSCLPHSVSLRGLFRPDTEGNGDAAFQWYSLLLVTGGMVWFIFDFVSDILLAKSFKERGGDFEFAFLATVVILFLSSVLGTSLSVYFCRQESKQEDDSDGSRERYFAVAAVLQLWHITRSMELMYYGCKSRSTGISDAERTEYTEKLKRREKHHSYLGYVESIVESLPQLLLQFYVLTALHADWEERGPRQRWFLLFKVSSAWLGISWAMTSIRVQVLPVKNTDDGKPMTFPQKLVCLPWRALELGISLCFLILYLCTDLRNGGKVIMGFLFLRTFVMYIYLARCVKMDRKRGRCLNIVLAFFLNFSFIGFHGGLTRGKVVVFYLLFYLTLAPLLFLDQVAHIHILTYKDAPLLYHLLDIFLFIHLLYVLQLVLRYLCPTCCRAISQHFKNP